MSSSLSFSPFTPAREGHFPFSPRADRPLLAAEGAENTEKNRAIEPQRRKRRKERYQCTGGPDNSLSGCKATSGAPSLILCMQTFRDTAGNAKNKTFSVGANLFADCLRRLAGPPFPTVPSMTVILSLAKNLFVSLSDSNLDSLFSGASARSSLRGALRRGRPDRGRQSRFSFVQFVLLIRIHT